MRSGLGLLAPREEGSCREKQGFGIQVPPPPPAACQEGIILDYPAVSSHPRGRLQPWERDPLPGPWVESPRREGQASLGSSSTFLGCSAGQGRGGRAWRTPQQARRASLGCARVLWGRPWARRDPGPLVSGPQGSHPAQRPPFTSGGLSTMAPGPVRLPPALGPGTHLGLVTHTWRCAVCPRVAGQAGAGPGLPGVGGALGFPRAESETILPPPDWPTNEAPLAEAPPTARPPPPRPHLSVRPTGEGFPREGAQRGAVWAATRHVTCGVPAGLPAAAPPAAPGESALGGEARSWAGGPQPRGLAAAQASGAEEIGLEGWRGAVAAAWGGSIWHMPLCPRDSLVTGCEPSRDLGRSQSIVLSSLPWAHIAGAELVVPGNAGRGTGCRFGTSPRGPWSGLGRSVLRCQALCPGAVL